MSLSFIFVAAAICFSACSIVLPSRETWRRRLLTGGLSGIVTDRTLAKALRERNKALKELIVAAKGLDKAILGLDQTMIGPAHQALLKALGNAEDLL